MIFLVVRQAGGYHRDLAAIGEHHAHCTTVLGDQRHPDRRRVRGALYRLGHAGDLTLCLVEFTAELHHPNPEHHRSSYQDHSRGHSQLAGA
jgi:hypothetical protein